jgi:hypothetical protein
MDRVILQYGTYNVLFLETLWDPIYQMIEEFIPLNVVPQYYLNLNGFCDSVGDVSIALGDIQTCVTNKFNPGRIPEMTVFKVGIGNIYNPPNPAMIDLSRSVYTGICVPSTNPSGGTQFNMSLPTSFTQLGISELGIYSSMTGELLMVSTFPPFDQTDQAVCQIRYIIGEASLISEQDGFIITEDGQKIILES